jgi:hypothetical protein
MLRGEEGRGNVLRGSAESGSLTGQQTNLMQIHCDNPLDWLALIERGSALIG